MTVIEVYLNDGRTFYYEVEDAIKAREHAHRIVNFGWRNVENGRMCYYPIHQINKVCFKIDQKDGLMKKYFAEPTKPKQESSPSLYSVAVRN